MELPGLIGDQVGNRVAHQVAAVEIQEFPALPAQSVKQFTVIVDSLITEKLIDLDLAAIHGFALPNCPAGSGLNVPIGKYSFIIITYIKYFLVGINGGMTTQQFHQQIAAGAALAKHNEFNPRSFGHEKIKIT